MGKRIAVLGTGAIGSSVGADLTRAGHDVWLIDQWPEHVEVMRSKGLHVTMPEGDLDIKVRALHLCEVASVRSHSISYSLHRSRPIPSGLRISSSRI